MCNVNTNDEYDSAVDLSMPRPDIPPVLTCLLPPLSPTKTSAEKNVPAAGTGRSDDQEQNLDADAFVTKAVILLPKKRPYVVPQIQTEEKQITDIRDIVTKQTEAAKEVESKTQSGVTDKMSQEPERAASDKPTDKPARETGKKQSQKVSTSQPLTSKASTSKASTPKASTPEASTSKASTSKASTPKASTPEASTSKASTSKASTSKASTPKVSTSKASTSKESSKAGSTRKSVQVRKDAGPNLPSGNKPSASTSAASSSSTDSHFWIETIKSKFQSDGYKNLLMESDFTEAQAKILQNVFHRTTRDLYNLFMNSDRIMRMYRCRECVFSINHRCVSMLFLHGGAESGDPSAVTFFPPERTIICLCHFSFFHAHTTGPSPSETVNTGSLEPTPHSVGEKSAVTLRCTDCDTIIIIEHPPDRKTVTTFTKWDAINNDDKEIFHEDIVDHLKPFTTKSLSLEELYICNHHCCLIFHRCTH